VHGPEQDFLTLTLHQFRGETCLEDYATKQFEWMIAAQIFYHYIRKILHFDKAPHSAYHLTPREEQCLALTAKSWRVEQIAKELNISMRTVNFHIQNANKKLGTNNKYQAVYKYFE
jgi:DNA-binding CsgD family transcriptional regulator